jgi:Na+-transporting methylmalonyl-CoA/oxaloacetate decarboxylase gamma subunit
MSSTSLRPELVEGPTMHPSTGSGRTRRDRGQGTIEFMAMVPLVLAVLVCALQVMAQAYTAHAASQAARDGARAFSLGQSAAAAVSASLPGNVELLNLRAGGPDHTVEVVVQPPIRMIPFVTDYTITRSVTMP